jgi:hypothetical protein
VAVILAAQRLLAHAEVDDILRGSARGATTAGDIQPFPGEMSRRPPEW